MPQDKSVSTARTRIANACRQCRRRKIKCSGAAPCVGCIETSVECLFDEAEKKILVSERYLQDLQSRVDRQKDDVWPSETVAPPVTQSAEAASVVPASTDTSTSVNPQEDAFSAAQNPLTSPESFFSLDSSSRQRYLGSSSSLAFSWRVRSFLQTSIGGHVVFNLVPDSEEETYTMASSSVRDTVALTSVDALPSLGEVKYLSETTLYHLGELYHVFDRSKFMTQVDAFFGSGGNLRQLDSLWHVQLLLVIAFGKLFLGRGASKLGPPGVVDFLRAMRLQQDVLDVWGDPILRIETLCLISLYLNTCDMRSSAYFFTGQAMHIALALGMNREASGNVGEAEYKRRRRAWWTIYVIDRKLSVTIGAPLMLRDEHIDISRPEKLDLGFSNAALNLHIRLAALDGEVISAAYRINGTIDQAFISGIQDVFGSMGTVADAFRGELGIDTDRPGEVSRTAATLNMMYYQCTIISARPILFVLLQQRLAALLNHPSTLNPMSEPVMSLISTCVASAVRIVSILSALHEQNLVEPFFMLDLQSVFSSAFILLLISIVCPYVPVDDGWISKCDEILVWMHSKGNVPAKSRMRDLAEMRAALEYITLHRDRSIVVPGVGNGMMDWNWDVLGGNGVHSSTSAAFATDNDAFWKDILDQLGLEAPEASETVVPNG